MNGISIDANGDLLINVRRDFEDKITSGIVIGEVRSQVAEHVITAFRGEFKEVPLIGGAVRNMLNGAPDPFWPADVQRQLKSQLVEADVNINNENIVVTIK